MPGHCPRRLHARRRLHLHPVCPPRLPHRAPIGVGQVHRVVYLDRSRRGWGLVGRGQQCQGAAGVRVGTDLRNGALRGGDHSRQGCHADDPAGRSFELGTIGPSRPVHPDHPLGAARELRPRRRRRHSIHRAGAQPGRDQIHRCPCRWIPSDRSLPQLAAATGIDGVSATTRGRDAVAVRSPRT